MPCINNINYTLNDQIVSAIIAKQDLIIETRLMKSVIIQKHIFIGTHSCMFSLSALHSNFHVPEQTLLSP